MSTLKLFATTHPLWFGLALTLAWLALLLHFLGNTIVSLQSLVTPLLEPDVVPYRRLLWFSLPLAALGIGLLVGVLPPRRLNT